MAAPIVKFVGDGLEDALEALAAVPAASPEGPAPLVKEAVDRAEEMSDEARARMDEIWDHKRHAMRKQAWREDPAFRTYFGTSALRKRQVEKVRRGIRRLENRLSRQLRIVVHPETGPRAGPCADGSNAFQSPDGMRGRKLHLCPRWFTLDPDERAAVLIHGLVRDMYRVDAKLDGETVRGPEAARRLARRKPRKARRNPENFKHFVLTLADSDHAAVG